MDGFVAIDKPTGMTSHDVVARVRRVLHTKKAGHAGTLDPDATGVLVVAVGQATRLLPHLPIEPKEYMARIAFGAATTTEDASGAVIAEADTSGLTESAMQAVLPQFTGDILQVPPMVSALHHEGKRLHELARAGIEVERAPRPVTIHQLSVSDFQPGERATATLHIICGGGTYVRTLCKDIGAALHLPAHMAVLVREAVGPFRRENAVLLENLTDSVLLPMESALPLPKIAVSDGQNADLGLGRAVQVTGDSAAFPEVILLYRERLRALARWEGGEYRPFKVFDL